jgi:hypothetical protein
MKRTSCNVDVTKQEALAIDTMWGILAYAPKPWTMEEFCNALTTLYQLKSDILEDSDNKMTPDSIHLSRVVENMYAAGCRQGPSIMSPVNKELLLTICGQMQVKSQSNHFDYQSYYWQSAARALRKYLYRNYVLTSGPIYKDAQGTVPASGDSLAHPS